MAQPGLVAGRYRLHEQIGSGGMGVVWRATDELLGRQVAIKRIRLDLLDGAAAEVTRQRTLREARIAAQLHHPQVVSIFDVLTVDGDPWLVLEYLPSESLSDALAARGPLPPPDAAGLGHQVADALAAAHAAGIVHRDVKPGNVLLGHSGSVKLTDFGISHVDGDLTITRADLVTGTPAFLAPEVARGGPSAAPSDVYSLGATIYAAVEGSAPYGPGHDNVFRLLQLVAAGQVPPPRQAGPLAPVLHRLMATDPAARPTAVEARDLLREVASNQTDGVVPAAVQMPPVPPPPGLQGALPPPVPYPVPNQQGLFAAAPPPAYPYPYGPPQPPRRRGAVVVAIVVAAVLVITVGVIIALLPGRGGGPVAMPTPPPAPPSPTPVPTDDPRAADPCSLVDPVPLREYGNSQLDVDFSDFQTCQVSVFPSTGGAVIVAAEFIPPLDPGLGVTGTVETRGTLSIGRQPENDGYCARTILLPDRRQVLVSAAERSGADADVCRMADTATETAVARITTTGITQRAVIETQGSLALLDACALLDADALAAAPGISATPTPGYANWSCSWGSYPTVSVYLSRQGTVDDRDGQHTTVAGRDVLVLPGGYDGSDSCLVQVLHRTFRSADGEARIEKLQILYIGDDSSDELCRVATELASSAIPLLPSLR